MGKFMMQVLAGVLGAVLSLVVVSIGVLLCMDSSCSLLDTLEQIPLLLFALVAPATAVSLAGQWMHVKGSFWLALVGMIAGLIIAWVASFLATLNLSNLAMSHLYVYGSALTPFLFLAFPSIGAAVGYNLPNWLAKRAERNEALLNNVNQESKEERPS